MHFNHEMLYQWCMNDVNVFPQVLLCCYMKYHQRCEKRCVACNVVPKYKGPFPRHVVGIMGMLCCGHIFMDQLTLGEWYGHYHIGHHCFSRTSLWCPIYTGSTWQLGSVYKGRSESNAYIIFHRNILFKMLEICTQCT